MSAKKVWWYAKGDKRFGPHTPDELKSLAAAGQIVASDVVWKEGLANWLQASSVKGLIPSGSGGMPPPLPSNPVAPHIASAPPREKPRKMSIFTKVALWVGGIFFGLIVLGVLVGPDKKGKSASPSVSSSVLEPPAPSVKVGEAFSTPTFEIQIRSAQARSSVGNYLFASQPSDGGVYIAIQWPVNAFRRPAVHLKAPDGTKYDPDLGASASYATELDLDSKVFSNLNPGIRVVDADVFEVSRQLFDPASWKILVDADRDTEVEFVVESK
jgi:hypothetical protein